MPEYRKNFIGFRKPGQNKKQVEKLLKTKSLATLKGDLQKVFNTYIRMRDTKYDKGQPYFICISCNQPKGMDQMNAGHFWPVGGHEAVRYDEDNVHGQCIHCNNFAANGPVMKRYEAKLLLKIGEKRFDDLAARRFNKSKMMAFEVELLIQAYKSKIEKLKVKNTPSKHDDSCPNCLSSDVIMFTADLDLCNNCGQTF